MKLFFAIAILYILNSNLPIVRQQYLQAYKNKENALLLKNSTDNNTDAIMIAYNGAAHTFLAKHSINPYKKLSYLNSGLKKLNIAASKDSLDIEIRFLRFSTEENIPGFIPFTSHLQYDKTFLLQHLYKTHPFFSTINTYLQQSKQLNKEEKAHLNNL